MPNPLTGDFEAVLQVSGGTVNRLLATLHQNAFADGARPSFPHAVHLHLGSPPIEGVRGRVQAQIGVPRVTLIQGAADRFRLRVGVRAWFRPDYGSSEFPHFIHGHVEAEYRVHAIDPSCPGWKKTAAEYLWIRVVRDSVRFEGTAVGDSSLVQIELPPAPSDPAMAIAKVTRQIAGLLAAQFEASPHPVSQGFRKGQLRSLSLPSGTAVVLPVGVSGPPAGDIASIDDILLDGRDLAIGVDVNAVLRPAQPLLAQVAGFQQSVKVHVSVPWPLPDIDTVYRVTVAAPTLTWHAHGTHAVLEIKASGAARTDSVLPDATFDVRQPISLTFDGSSGRLSLTRMPAYVSVSASGVGAGFLASEIKSGLFKLLKERVDRACTDAQPALDATTDLSRLTAQLRTLDAQATASVDDAEFLPAGLVLRGTIDLSPRRAPSISVALTPEGDAHSALESWIPGGRVDRLEWTWAGFQQGSWSNATLRDRFLLRPSNAFTGRWGAADTSDEAVAGLGGTGRVCLLISGVRVDSTSGELVPVVSLRRCQRFGRPILVDVAPGRRLRLPDLPDLMTDVPFPQLALAAAAGRPGDVRGANTLLVHAGERWTDATGRAIVDGLDQCGRGDAGLRLLVLFRAGALGSPASPVMADVRGCGRRAGVPTEVNEDVDGSWAEAFGVRGDLAWRLIHPSGAVPWSHDGALDGARLATALDAHLLASPPDSIIATRLRYEVNDTIGTSRLLDDVVESRCPRPTLGRAHVGTVVTFVAANNAASQAALRELAARYPEGDERVPRLVLVVDGATEADAATLAREVGSDVLAYADPVGRIADRFGVGVWPSTVAIDHLGRVVGTTIGGPGGDPGDAAPPPELEQVSGD